MAHFINRILLTGGAKTLMFFEGCAFPQLGCTLLLRGASEQELKKLKSVTNATVFMYYNAKLEKSFLLDEFAKPPTVPSFTFVEEVVSPKHGNLKFYQSLNLSKKGSETSSEGKNQNEKSTGDAKPENLKCEEKRISTKSVVDHDDPLHLKSKSDDDEVFTTNSENSESSDLSFMEVPLKQNNFRTALQDTVLSYSPYIVVSKILF